MRFGELLNTSEATLASVCSSDGTRASPPVPAALLVPALLLPLVVGLESVPISNVDCNSAVSASLIHFAIGLFAAVIGSPVRAIITWLRTTKTPPADAPFVIMSRAVNAAVTAASIRFSSYSLTESMILAMKCERPRVRASSLPAERTSENAPAISLIANTTSSTVRSAFVVGTGWLAWSFPATTASRTCNIKSNVPSSLAASITSMACSINSMSWTVVPLSPSETDEDDESIDSATRRHTAKTALGRSSIAKAAISATDALRDFDKLITSSTLTGAFA